MATAGETARFRAGDAAAAAGLACVLEIPLVLAVASGRIEWMATLALHGAVVVGLIGYTLANASAKRPAAPLLLVTLLIAIAGPCGALGGVLLGALARQRADDVARLDTWYDRISFSTEVSSVTRLADSIATGRTARLADAAPPSFAEVFARGTIREQQVILGLIARHVHPRYLPALKLALVNHEPIIRVQAAAVAAKIRGELAGRAEAAIHAASDPLLETEQVLRLLDDARACAQSGLMEEPDRARTEQLVSGFMAAAADRIGRAAKEPGRVLSETLVRQYEGYLLSHHRFAEFRLVRRRRHWQQHGGLQYRRLPKRRALRGGA